MLQRYLDDWRRSAEAARLAESYTFHEAAGNERMLDVTEQRRAQLRAREALYLRLFVAELFYERGSHEVV